MTNAVTALMESMCKLALIFKNSNPNAIIALSKPPRKKKFNSVNKSTVRVLHTNKKINPI